MKKKILKLFLLAVVTICTTIGITNRENESTLSLIFANVEALASTNEGGIDSQRVKHTTYGGKYFSPGSTMYERTGVGDSCIKWSDFAPTGSPNGYCYTYGE